MRKLGFVAAVMVAFLLSAVEPAVAEMTNTCKFNRGPRSGETQRYPHLDPIPVGSPCHDGNGSSGVAISEKGRSDEDDDSSETELTNTCKFTRGPRKGEKQRYPDLDPIPVGSPCHDGKGSAGVAISEKRHSSDDSEETDLTNTCKFTRGPRKGEKQRYPDLDPIPVGSPCNDGKGSSGVAVSENEDETDS